MAEIKILTANIAHGLPRMNHMASNLRGHYGVHRAAFLAYFLLRKAVPSLTAATCPARVEYLKATSGVKDTISIIRRYDPDLVVLNEIAAELHELPLKSSLNDLGFVSFALGKSKHYSDACVATLIASKCSADPLSPIIPQREHMGGGGGVAAFRIKNTSITVIGVHLASGFGKLWRSQVENLARFAAKEQSQGRKTVLAGDFNQEGSVLQSIPEFSKLGLRSVCRDWTALTCAPNFLYRKRALDHIFVPNDWSTKDPKTIQFGSDHLAVSVKIDTSESKTCWPDTPSN